MTICPCCHSDNVRYLGIVAVEAGDDSGGLVPAQEPYLHIYKCEDCGTTFDTEVLAGTGQLLEADSEPGIAPGPDPDYDDMPF